jgi:uncharacterized membrane protein
MHRNLILRTAVVGFATGIRSMSGMAIVAAHAASNPRGFKGTRFGWLAYRPVAALLGLMAAGEMVVDKLPILPARTAPGPLFGRIQFSALAGSALFTEAGAPAWQGALLAAACAIAGAFAGYNYRVRTARALNAPDLPIALIEDAATAGLAAAALSTYE